MMNFSERQDKVHSVFYKVKTVMESCTTKEQADATKKWGETIIRNWVEHMCKDLGAFHALYLYGLRDATVDSISILYDRQLCRISKNSLGND